MKEIMPSIFKTIFIISLIMLVCVNNFGQDSKAAASSLDTNNVPPETKQCGDKDYDCIIARESGKIAGYKADKSSKYDETSYYLSYIIRAYAYYNKDDYRSALSDYNYAINDSFLCCYAARGQSL